MFKCFFTLTLLCLSCHTPDQDLDISYYSPLANTLELAVYDLAQLMEDHPKTYLRIENQEPLLLEDLHLLLSRKFSDHAIIAFLKHTKTHLTLSSREIIDLTLLGVNESLLTYLMRTK